MTTVLGRQNWSSRPKYLLGLRSGNSNHVGHGVLRSACGKEGKHLDDKVTLCRRCRQKQSVDLSVSVQCSVSGRGKAPFQCPAEITHKRRLPQGEVSHISLSRAELKNTWTYHLYSPKHIHVLVFN